MIEKPQLSQSGTLLAPTLKKEKKNNNTIKKDKTSREKKIPWNPDSNDIVFRKKEEEPQTKLVGFDIAPGVCTLVASEPPNTTLSFFFFFSFSLHSPMVFLFLFYPTVLHWEKNKNNQNKNRKILKFKKTMKVA